MDKRDGRRSLLGALAMTLGGGILGLWSCKRSSPDEVILEPRIGVVVDESNLAEQSMIRPIEKGFEIGARDFGECYTAFLSTEKDRARMLGEIEEMTIQYLVSFTSRDMIFLAEHVYVPIFSLGDPQRIRGVNGNVFSISDNREDIYHAFAERMAAYRIEEAVTSCGYDSGLIRSVSGNYVHTDYLLNGVLDRELQLNTALVLQHEILWNQNRRHHLSRGYNMVCIETEPKDPYALGLPDDVVLVYPKNNIEEDFLQRLGPGPRHAWASAYAHDIYGLIMMGHSRTEGWQERFLDFMYSQKHELSTGDVRFDENGMARRDITLVECLNGETKDYKYEFT